MQLQEQHHHLVVRATKGLHTVHVLQQFDSPPSKSKLSYAVQLHTWIKIQLVYPLNLFCWSLSLNYLRRTRRWSIENNAKYCCCLLVCSSSSSGQKETSLLSQSIFSPIYYVAKQRFSSDLQPCFQTRGQTQKVTVRPRNKAGKVPSSIKGT